MVDQVRAKLKLQSITEHADTTLKTLKFYAQYDSKIPEDIRFQKATPTGHIELNVDNPNLGDFFKTGQYYYVDFTIA